MPEEVNGVAFDDTRIQPVISAARQRPRGFEERLVAAGLARDAKQARTFLLAAAVLMLLGSVATLVLAVPRPHPIVPAVLSPYAMPR
jgi:hypothetical protein